MAAHEILLATPAIRNLIREAKTPQIASLMQIGSRVGMCTLKDAVYKLVEENVITKADAKSAIAAAGADDSDDNDELTNLAANKTNATTGATPPKATAAAAPAPQRPSQSPRTSSGFGSDNNSF